MPYFKLRGVRVYRYTKCYITVLAVFCGLQLFVPSANGFVPDEKHLNQYEDEWERFSEKINNIRTQCDEYSKKYGLVIRTLEPFSEEWMAAMNGMMATRYAKELLIWTESTYVEEYVLSKMYANKSKEYPGQEKLAEKVRNVVIEYTENIEKISSQLSSPRLMGLQVELKKINVLLQQAFSDWPFPALKALENSNGAILFTVAKQYAEFGKTCVEFGSFFKVASDELERTLRDKAMSPNLKSQAVYYVWQFKMKRMRAMTCMAWAMICGSMQSNQDIPDLARFKEASLKKLSYGSKEFENLCKEGKTDITKQGSLLTPAFVAEIERQTGQWRKALDAALASDGLSLPPEVGN